MLKADNSAALDRPYVGELRIDSSTGDLMGTTITPEGDDSVASIDEFLHVHSEAVPVFHDAGKDALENLLWTHIGTPICVRRLLSRFPNHLGIVGTEHAWYVTAGERLVHVFNDLQRS